MEEQRRTWNGNSALALGAIASMVQNVSGYPGKPITTIINELLQFPRLSSLHIEWSINEKTAFEFGFGAAIANQRSLVVVKHVGMNVLLDSLMTANMTGASAGIVLIVGDDPGSTGSQNEEDSRFLGAFAEIPVLEPSTPLEGFQMIQDAFDMSERFHIPVMIHTISAYSTHAEEIPTKINPQELVKKHSSTVGVVRQQGNRWMVYPKTAIVYHKRLHSTLDVISENFDRSVYNGIVRDSQSSHALGVITAGYTYTKLHRILVQKDIPEIAVLKIGTLYPFPASTIQDFISQYSRILVLEEGEPFIEHKVRELVSYSKTTERVIGKLTGDVPRVDELSHRMIGMVLKKMIPDYMPSADIGLLDPPPIVPSYDTLCNGCPYTPAFLELKRLVKELEVPGLLIIGDTGCVIRASNPPLSMIDIKYSMGSSIGVGVGVAHALRDARDMDKRTVVSIIGDSAFLHSGLQHLINAKAISDPNLLVLIMDNKTTALTGFQPHPTSPYTIHGVKRRPFQLKKIVEAVGVSNVTVVNPFDESSLEEAMRQALLESGIRVVIIDHPCPKDKHISSLSY
ncbi:MAG: thiamine pyrophosphate-dependent enzyme [Candidatus Ranarchaeia archaeon]